MISAGYYAGGVKIINNPKKRIDSVSDPFNPCSEFGVTISGVTVTDSAQISLEVSIAGACLEGDAELSSGVDCISTSTAGGAINARWRL